LIRYLRNNFSGRNLLNSFLKLGFGPFQEVKVNESWLAVSKVSITVHIFHIKMLFEIYGLILKALGNGMAKQDQTCN
jgi:hypothetical protein